MSELSETEFRRHVREALDRLHDQIMELDADEIDAIPTEGVLTIEFPTGGPFVLTQQTPARELWLSANFKAAHFRFAEGGWVETATGEALTAAMKRLVEARLGHAVSIA